MDNVAGLLPVPASPRAARGAVWDALGGLLAASRPVGAALVAQATRPAVAATVVVLALITAHLLLHQDEGGWVGKVSWAGTTTLDGHLVEWEWGHVGEAVTLIDADGPAMRSLASQNLYRFVGAYLLALWREPLGGYYVGAVAAHLVAWLAACWALYTLAGLAGASPRAAVLAAAFTATGPGFIGYLGQVDAHPFGYAAVAVWPALLERLGVFGPARGAGVAWLRPAVAGLALSVAAYTIEVGYPLLLFAWLCYGLGAWRPGVSLRWRLTQLAIMTVAFLVPYLGFRLMADLFLFETIIPFNDPGTYLRGSWRELLEQGPRVWLANRVESIVGRWGGVFPTLLSALALVGASRVPRPWLVWAASFVLSFAAAIALTKPAVRELYLTFPPVYVLAACGADWLGVRISRLFIPNADPARQAWLRRLVLAGLFLAVAGVTNADLWGNYYFPAQWYQCKVTIC